MCVLWFQRSYRQIRGVYLQSSEDVCLFLMSHECAIGTRHRMIIRRYCLNGPKVVTAMAFFT